MIEKEEKEERDKKFATLRSGRRPWRCAEAGLG
jgi:hypothetical protein